jgi:hypothetical protein
MANVQQTIFSLKINTLIPSYLLISHPFESLEKMKSFGPKTKNNPHQGSYASLRPVPTQIFCTKVGAVCHNARYWRLASKSFSPLLPSIDIGYGGCTNLNSTHCLPNSGFMECSRSIAAMGQVSRRMPALSKTSPGRSILPRVRGLC